MKGNAMGEKEALAIIEGDVKNNSVFLYMKGTPEQPMCGFSSQVIHILKAYQVPFESRNVLDDYDIREGVKKFANWPTIPQLYVKGQFVGGCDIISDMHRKGELKDLFTDVAQ